MSDANGQSAGNSNGSKIEVLNLPTQAAPLGSAAGTPAASAAAGPAERLWGRLPCTLDELNDAIADVADVPGSTIELSKERELGRYAVVNEIPLEEWSIARVVKLYGAGNYRFKIKGGDNPRHPRKLGRFEIAGEVTPAAAHPTFQPPAAPAAPLPAAAPLGGALDASSILGAAMTMLTATMQAQAAAAAQQQQLLMGILTAQASKSPEVSQLTELMKVAKMMGGLGKGGDSEGDNALVENLATIGAKVVEQIQSNRSAPQPTPAPRNMVGRPIGRIENKAQTTTHAPPPGASEPHQSPAEHPVGEGMTPFPPGSAGDVSAASSTVPQDQPAGKKQLDLVAQILLSTAGAADPDLAGVASTAALILGDDNADQLLGVPDALLIPQFVTLYPDLAGKEVYVGEVLKEFRALYADDADGEGDAQEGKES